MIEPVEKWFKPVGLLSIVLLVLPFAIYFVARITGTLPSETVWYLELGNNHGPWRWSVQGLLIGFPLAVCVIVTAFLGLTSCIRNRSIKPLWNGGVLCVAQAIGVLVQLELLFWTID
jgi:hypothetical protein